VSSIGKKRPASAGVGRLNAVPESRPVKKPKLAESAPALSAIPKTKSQSQSKLKPKQTALERLISGPSPKPNKKREKDVEDDEIAWLEAKLGISKQGKRKDKYGSAFSADGLDGKFFRLVL
jgi:hypothetical protein